MKNGKGLCVDNFSLWKKRWCSQNTQKINGIKIYRVDGTYDFVVKVNAEDMDKLKDIIRWQIRRISTIQSAVTLIVL